jgi:hypothetical protein
MSDSQKTHVILVVQGGVVQSVMASDDRVAVGVIDYDTDGIDRTTAIPQDGGYTRDAVCHVECVSIEPENVRELGALLGMTVPPDYSAEAEELSAAIDAASEDDVDKVAITADLDDMVTDAFNALSASVNNGGRAGQIRFLLERGFSVDYLRDSLGMEDALKSPGPRA